MEGNDAGCIEVIGERCSVFSVRADTSIEEGVDEGLGRLSGYVVVQVLMRETKCSVRLDRQNK